MATVGFHSLFSMNAFLGGAWDAAGATETDSRERMEALLMLAENRDKLPSPVFFRVPGNTKRDGWKDLYQMSVRACQCAAKGSPGSWGAVQGSRRLLMPKRGRCGLIPNTPPQTVRLVAGTPDCRLVIGPHGGDQASAYLTIASQSGELAAWHSLYARDVTLPAYFGHQLSSGRHADRVRLKLEDTSAAVHALGELMCWQTLPDGLTVPVCSIIDCGVENGRQWMEVAVDAGSSVLDITDPFPLHICTRA